MSAACEVVPRRLAQANAGRSGQEFEKRRQDDRRYLDGPEETGLGTVVGERLKKSPEAIESLERRGSQREVADKSREAL